MTESTGQFHTGRLAWERERRGGKSVSIDFGFYAQRMDRNRVDSRTDSVISRKMGSFVWQREHFSKVRKANVGRRTQFERLGKNGGGNSDCAEYSCGLHHHNADFLKASFAEHVLVRRSDTAAPEEHGLEGMENSSHLFQCSSPIQCQDPDGKTPLHSRRDVQCVTRQSDGCFSWD